MTDSSTPPDSACIPSKALAAYDRQVLAGLVDAACPAMIAALAGSAERDWLDCARALILRADTTAARPVLAAALNAFPDSADLRFALAGVLQQIGETAAAEDLLRQLLSRHPSHAAAAFFLAGMLRDSGRTRAAATVLRTLFETSDQDIANVIQAIELLYDCQRQRDAAAICEMAFAKGITDARLHAYAGMLDIQLGEFTSARERYAYALAHDPRAVEWNIQLGLATMQRYSSDRHPDIALFQGALANVELSPNARSSTLFALAKAYDDLGNYAQAADYLRKANTIAHATARWSGKRWRRTIEGRLARKPVTFALAPAAGWTPVFIVGVPRSGTTLVAELLVRHPDVCNRGELNWLAELAGQVGALAEPSRPLLQQAAELYEVQCRQDDSTAHWFIDKQPLNLLNVDLILALWPNARIVLCERNPRDTALSLWTQSFLEDVQAYAYNFDDIIGVIRGCNRLATHWQKRYSDSIYTLRYEELAGSPEYQIAALAAWLGLPAQSTTTPQADRGGAISTASVWQARQPVYTRSVDRWRHYATLFPELLRLPEA